MIGIRPQERRQRGDSVEQPLFEERMWWPWRNLLLIGLFAELVISAIVVGGGAGLGAAIVGYAVATVGSIFWIALFQTSARRIRNRVGDRTFTFGRCPSVPVTAIRDVERVDGEDAVKRCVERLGAGAKFLGASSNPRLMGVLAPPRSRHAVAVHVDPAASRTATFLVATRRPDDLMGALQKARQSAPGVESLQLG